MDPNPSNPLESFASQPHGVLTFVAGGTVLKGDVNLDGSVTFLDINPFIQLLAASGFQAEADCDCDEALNFLDIQPFIDILAAGP